MTRVRDVLVAPPPVRPLAHRRGALAGGLASPDARRLCAAWQAARTLRRALEGMNERPPGHAGALVAVTALQRALAYLTARYTDTLDHTDARPAA